MNNYVPPSRREPPRAHVIITDVDIPRLKAVGVDRKNSGVVSIDLSVHNSQMIVWPRKDEEWFLTKINEVWILDKKAGLGNEGLLKDALPGDLVTATTGNQLTNVNSLNITTSNGTTLNGGTTLNNGATISSGLVADTLSIPPNIFLDGNNGSFAHVHVTNTDTSLICDGNIQGNSMHCINTFTTGPINCYGTLNMENNSIGSAAQINATTLVSSGDAYVSGNVQGNTMHCINTFTTGPINCYGDLNMDGYNINNANSVHTGGATMDGGGLFGNQVNGYGASFGGVDINSGGIATHGKSITASNFYADNQVTTGGARMDGGGGFFNQCNGYGASFGGIDINNGGIATYGRAITASAFYTVPSERRLKTDISPIEDSHLDVVLGAPLYHYRYNAEEITYVDPDEWHRGLMVDDLPSYLVGEAPSGEIAPDLAAVQHTTWGAIQELSKKLDDANKLIADLTARLETLEEVGS